MYYQKYKRGFVSTVFLMIFLNITVLTSALIYKAYKEMQILANMKKVNEIVESEAIAIDYVKCLLLNDQKEDVLYSDDYCNFDIIFYEDYCIVSINNPVIETLTIMFEDNNMITDISYST